MRISLLAIMVFILLATTYVSGHGGDQAEDSTTNSPTLTLPVIYAITLIVGIIIAIGLYYFQIVRSRKLLYEMLISASVLLTIDFYIMSINL